MNFLSRSARSTGRVAGENLPKVWIVLDLEPKKRGSLEQGILALAEALRSSAQTTIVVACPPAPWLEAGLRNANATIRVLKFRPAAPAQQIFAGWMRQERPDLVHFHFIRAYSPFVAAARAAGAKIVLHDHITLGVPVVPTAPRGKVAKLVVHGFKWVRAAALNRRIDRRVAVSGFVADSVHASEFVRRGEIVVNENGIDLARFTGADGQRIRAELGVGSAPLIVCPSRMAPEKGVDVLIHALARARADAQLAIVGSGPGHAACVTLAQQLGIADRVRFLGVRNDIEHILAAADVVVVPSLWDEAFGLVVIEAMAAGAPVIVTRSGAMPDIVDHGRCGMVVPKGDAAALAVAINRLIDDRELAQQIRVDARRRVMERYDLDSWVERNLEVYEGVLRRELARAPRSSPIVVPALLAPPVATESVAALQLL